MKILVLGDVMGLSGRTALKKNLSNIISENKIDFGKCKSLEIKYQELKPESIN